MGPDDVDAVRSSRRLRAEGRMGFITRLRGTEQGPSVRRTVAEVKAALPEGWRIVDLRAALIGRRPVKLMAHGATVAAPDGRRMLCVASGEDAGVLGLRGILDAAHGRVPTAPRWAPHRITPTGPARDPHPLLAPQSPEEDEWRRRALALLPAGTTVSDVDTERLADVAVCGVVALLPQGWGAAGVGLTRAEAWRALAERLSGELRESPVWFPPLD